MWEVINNVSDVVTSMNIKSDLHLGKDVEAIINWPIVLICAEKVSTYIQWRLLNLLSAKTDSSEEEEVLLSIFQEQPQSSKCRLIKMQTNGTYVIYKIDTGAWVNVIVETKIEGAYKNEKSCEKL